MKYPTKVTVGVVRGDGDLHILAILNNTDAELPQDTWQELVRSTVDCFTSAGMAAQAFDRDDTLDYLEALPGEDFDEQAFYP